MARTLILHNGDIGLAAAVERRIAAEFDTSVALIDIADRAVPTTQPDFVVGLLTKMSTGDLVTVTDRLEQEFADTGLVLFSDSCTKKVSTRGWQHVPSSAWRAALPGAAAAHLPAVRAQVVESYEPFCYLGLSTGLTDAASQATVVTHGGGEPLIVDDDGVVFPGSLTVTLQSPRIPTGRAPRTFCAWVKFLGLPQDRLADGRYVAIPQFVFSYGTETHGTCFGLYFGVPFFPQAMMRYPGLRVFFWSSPEDWDERADSGDTAPFAPAAPGEWLHLAVTYDGSLVRAYANGSLALTTPRTHATTTTDRLNIGGFVPGREDHYARYRPQGYIREFLGFERELKGAAIRGLASDTRRLVGLR